MTHVSRSASASQEEILNWLERLSDQIQTRGQRLILSFQGDEHWCGDMPGVLKSVQANTLVISDRQAQHDAVAYTRVDMLLGSEFPVVVLDLFDGLNPDVLCIASGLVCAGGLLVLLSPGPDDWGGVDDRYALWQDNAVSSRALFVEYLFSSLAHEHGAGITLVQGQSLPPIPEIPLARMTPLIAGKTAGQSLILGELDDWLGDKKQSIALITADRGQGKSSCLGFILSDMVINRQLSVVVTAPSRRCAAILMNRAKMQSPGAFDIDFTAPDQLIKERKPADILIIDEAAMLPYPMLQQLCAQYRKVIMATTTGGYEGTGQGFLLRFVARWPSDELRRFELSSPVRWGSGDLLEAWLESTLFLKPTSCSTPPDIGRRAACRCRVVNGSVLAENRVLLAKVYSLMASAHYRTRPSDLRMLMENPQILMVLAEVDDDLVGVALLNPEGGLDKELCEQVHLGLRRPRGNLLAQMISAQAGDQYFARYKGLRVVRIAVVESWRRNGVGRQVIETATGYAEDRGFDYIGASLALDAESAAFWDCCQFSLVHIGFALGKSSGNHSIAVIRRLDPELDDHIVQLQARIQRYLPVWLCQYLQQMDSASVVALLKYSRFHSTLSKLDLDEVQAFAFGHKGFELCFGSLQRFVMQAIADQSADTEVHSWLIEKAVQNRDWNCLSVNAGATGRKQSQQKLRELVGVLISAESPAPRNL